MSRAQVGNLEAEVEIVRFLRESKQLAFVAHLVSPLYALHRGRCTFPIGFSWDAIVVRLR